MADPIKNQAYELDPVALENFDGEFQVNPTIVPGDFQLSVDGGPFSNLATLPIVSPAGSSTVLIALSAVENSGDLMAILGIDQSQDEWKNIKISWNNPVGTTESLMNILEGDHIETSTRLIVNKKGTTEKVLDKAVGGSLLRSDITVTTTET